MINVYICDKDLLMLSGIKRMLQKLAANHKLDICTKGFESGNEMISAYNRDKDIVNLVCLNTVIQSESGIQVGKKLREQGFEGEIIFFSEDEKDVLNTFEVRALAYFVKGKEVYVEFKDIFLALAKKLVWRPEQCLLCSKTGTIKRIPLKDIKYIEIQGRTSKIHYGTEVAEIGIGLSKMEEHLEDKYFVRVNRSLLVNMNYVKERKNRSIILLDGEEISVGEKYFEMVTNRLSDSFWEPCFLACS